MKRELVKLSEEYFGFMAFAYPVMSLSDEFYFLPRASKAIQYLNLLDSLDREKIRQDISWIKQLKIRLEHLNIENMELEMQIDWRLLKQSMTAFLREFDGVKIWQKDPNLYLKIIILGLDQIVNKLSMIKTDIKENLLSRIKQIPLLLNEAKVNLIKIPLLYQEAAFGLAESIIDYLKNPTYLSSREKPTSSELIKLSKAAIQSLYDFKGFLKKKTGSESFIKDRGILKDLLINSFSYKRSLKEIFEIASDQYQRITIELKNVSNHIEPSKDWQAILSDYKLRVRNKKELLNLYYTQIHNLKDFLAINDLITIPKTQRIRVEQTPFYLTPMRASASYSCPLSRNQKESAFFYVTVNAEKSKRLKRFWENIHQEYIFVTAHETYPGHHLLDSIRANIENPIRQQIESPLFYEGWASYAERLIQEFGYINNEKQRLVGLRRQAWRAIRAKLDVGIRINKMTPRDAAEQLQWLGYSSRRIKAMLKHYILTYGYQLCYSIGKFEIERLMKRFAPRLGRKNFHDCLLAGGELPFELIKRRMDKLCQKTS